MAFFSRKSKLRSALERGNLGGGKLGDALNSIEDYELKTRDDGEAVCEALDRQSFVDEKRRKSSEATHDLHSLVALFQQVEDGQSEACQVLRERGCPKLVRLARELAVPPVEYPAESVLMFILRILAMYGTQDGTDLVIETAKSGIEQNSYMWEIVLRGFTADHPHLRQMLAQLSDPLPQQFLAVALLDAANQAILGGAEVSHPFNTPVGKARLMEWLSSSDKEHFSYAHSATAALPFIGNPERDQLLAVAMDHADTGVQMEAAWASAKLGSEGGVKLLSRMCLEVNTSDTAVRYLKELGRDDAVPPECEEPDFAAAAEMSQWLAHPQEFGSPPDEIDLYDTREMFWPPTDDYRRVWLFKYRYRGRKEDGGDEAGLGMVGSVTFALFGEATVNLSPEDAYGLHCFWELEMRKDRRAKGARSPAAGRAILDAHN